MVSAGRFARWSVALTLSITGCSSPSYQTDITTFGQGVGSLSGAATTTQGMLQSATIQTELSNWSSSNTRLKVLAGCYQSGAQASPCAIVPISATMPPAPTQAQQDLSTASVYLDALQKYADALSALANSTDPDTATKNAQAISSSLNSLASAVGTANASDKAAATNAASAVGALNQVFAFAISQWRNDTIKQAVHGANPLVQNISNLVAAAFVEGLGDLSKSYTNYTTLQKKYPIIDPANTKLISPVKYTAQFVSLQKDVATAQALLRGDAIVAAQDLGQSHAALDQALQSGNPSMASDSLKAFLSAAQKAQTTLQKLAGP
jgi:hypothetical protein